MWFIRYMQYSGTTARRAAGSWPPRRFFMPPVRHHFCPPPLSPPPYQTLLSKPFTTLLIPVTKNNFTLPCQPADLPPHTHSV